MKVLFICNQNQNRSKTAEHIFKGHFETASAGLYNDTPVSAEEIDWADIIVVMEDAMIAELNMRFPALYLKKKIISLKIPDTYMYGDDTLIRILHSRMNELFDPYF
jgi:predicted protein tyrosine phosphatase